MVSVAVVLLQHEQSALGLMGERGGLVLEQWRGDYILTPKIVWLDRGSADVCEF